MEYLENKYFELNELVNPKLFNDILDLDNEDFNILEKNLESMLLIRSVEKKLAEKKKEGIIRGPVHLGVGQEAIPVGIANSLTKNDRVFGAHRSHSHLLALGSDVQKLFAEILSRSTGHSKGMGGSMHLIDKNCGFYGSVPIVAGTIPIAVGAALAAKQQNTNDIAVAYFGDGASEEGVFHESLNLAKVLNLPILFVCENNLFSSHMHISLRQPFNSISRFAFANKINFKVVDGNNICEVSKNSNELINEIRKGNGPGFLEAITFRWYGHVDWREDVDVGVNRSKDEINSWRERDPVDRLVKGLINSGAYNMNIFKKLSFDIIQDLEKKWEKALKDPYPTQKDSESYLYK